MQEDKKPLVSYEKALFLFNSKVPKLLISDPEFVTLTPHDLHCHQAL